VLIIRVSSVGYRKYVRDAKIELSFPGQDGMSVCKNVYKKKAAAAAPRPAKAGAMVTNGAALVDCAVG
jgi:hypothetical protein